MSDLRTIEAIKDAKLILSVDDLRLTTDPFKLSAPLRTLLADRLQEAQDASSGVSLSEGGRTEGSGDLRAALNALEVLVRDGYKFIAAIASYEITPPQRAALFEKYGWEQGELGDFPDDRITDLAAKAALATPQISETRFRYPAELLLRLKDGLKLVDDLKPSASTGDREGAVDERNDDRTLLEKAVARARFFYCQASDATDQTPELSKIGMQPRRDRGTVQHANSQSANSAVGNPSEGTNPV